MAAIDVDFVIVGGGITGLWALRQLRQQPGPPSAVLITNGGIGAGQTSHAHAMLHRGHYAIGKFSVDAAWIRSEALKQEIAQSADGRDRFTMADLLTLGADRWRQAGAPIAGTPAIYLDTHRGTSQLRQRIGRAPDQPGVSFDRWIVREEAWVDPLQVTDWIYRQVADACWPGPAIVRTTNAGVEVEVGSLVLHPRTLIVAAGLANEGFMKSLQVTRQPPGSAIVVTCNALIMRGPHAAGPKLTATVGGQVTTRHGGGLRWLDLGNQARHGLLSSHTVEPLFAHPLFSQ